MTAKADTICAIATPPGRGGVGVIRISGPDALAIASSLCGTLPPPRQAGLRTFRDPEQATLDSGLVLVFPGPASFTGEDVVEIQAHGAPVMLELIMRALIHAGARRARPGEFSERAFINDRLDLAQAEAIADLIAAGNEQAARAATRSLEGELSQRATELAEALIELRVWVEAALDFPDEDVDFLADGQVAERAAALTERTADLLSRARSGRLLNDGVRIAIVGAPNAGKSSLLNALARRDSAIVTDIPGTTRDVLRETVNLAGLPVTLADTAGLREARDQVEIEGVRRARGEIESADLLFWVVDASADEPPALDDLPPGLTVLRIDNKIDLIGAEPSASDGRVGLSVTSGAGLDGLESEVGRILGARSDSGGEFSARQRHVEAIERAALHIDRGLAEIRATASGELLAEELRLAADALGEITGRMTSDELLGRIFSGFCIGK